MFKIIKWTAISTVALLGAGFFLFGDMGIDTRNSVGVQFAMADLPENPSADASELDLYFTHYLTEVRRLRFGARVGESGGIDENVFYVQFTNFFGNHNHGMNW